MKTIKLLSLSIAALFALNACLAADAPSKPTTDERSAISEDRPDVDGLAVNDPADDSADGTAEAPLTCQALQTSCTSGASCCSGDCQRGGACGPSTAVCCEPVGGSCATSADCCQTGGQQYMVCSAGKCIGGPHACR